MSSLTSWPMPDAASLPKAWLSGSRPATMIISKNRDQIEHAKTQAEFAADLLKELGGIDFTTIHRACLALAAIQMFTAIDEYGDEALRKMLQTKPASWLSLVNTLCNIV